MQNKPDSQSYQRGEKGQEGGLPDWINNVSSINLPQVFLNKSICSAFNFIYQVIFYSPNVYLFI